MRLLLVSHYYPSHIGGIEIFSGRLAEVLSKQGVEVSWAASDCDLYENENIKLVPMCSNNFLEKKYGMPYPLWSFSALYGLFKEVKETDIIFIQEAFYWGSLFAVLFAKIFRKPTVLTQHVGFIPFKSQLANKFLHLGHRFLSLPILRMVDSLVFVSELPRNYFVNQLRLDRPYRIIAPGLDLSHFILKRMEECKKSSSSMGLRGLFVGRFCEKKGIGLLKEIIRSSPHIEWTMVGKGRMDIQKWKFSNLKVLNSVGQTEIASIYQAHDFLLLPSSGEGLPLVLQEAIAMGIPCVVSERIQTNDLRPFVIEVPSLYHEKPQAWIDKIREISEQKKHLSTLPFPESWLIQKVAARYLKIFQLCLNQQ